MEKINNFELLCSLRANDRVEVKKYRSSSSGLTVAIACVPGPLVNGFFTLATEAFDDDGLPHTLEHLIFLGSEDYPYKGVLDLLANRNLASGTNAWTDTDHTCYTMTTAGTEGFLNLMPIYIDHILFPTLEDAGFTTEVHHVTGEGQDAGVVYCEMQGRENSGESRVHLEMLRAAYPGRCGYKSETGGLLKNLRESTNNIKVRQYHKDFYRPENLTLIITGQVEPREILEALSGLEAKIQSKGIRPPFVRPWQNTVPPLTKSVDMVVPYASDEEDNGMVYVAWRGPSAVSELYEMTACSMLLRYLSDSSISPLQKEFVEIADPLASSVGYSLQENSESLLYVTFENVPVPKLSEVKPRLDAKLQEIHSRAEPLHMKRLKAVIHRQKLETLLNLETQPHNSVAFMLIGDLLYGKSTEDLDQRLNPIRDLDKMTEEKEDFWLALLDRYLVKGPSITVRGKPSVDERSRLTQEEEIRITDQVEYLGQGGLKEKSEALAAATARNERVPPAAMLTKMAVPDPANIHFHKIAAYSSDEAPPSHLLQLDSFPLYVNVDSIGTHFVYLMVLMDTRAVPPELRMYLPLYLDSILESPVLRDGALVSHETVVAELEQDTIAAATSLGIGGSCHFGCGPYCQTASLTLQVEPSKYERGVQWLRELLYSTQFTAERLSIIAAKLVNEVAEFRRKGNKVAQDVILDLNFEKGNNNHFVSNMIRQQQFLSKVGKQLSEGIENAVTDMEKLRGILTDPKNMAVRLAANLDTLPSQIADLAAPWSSLLPNNLSPTKHKLTVTRDSELLRSGALEKPARVLGLGCVESAFLSQSIPCIADFDSPDLPPLLVFLQYLTQLEGPMWKQIRGLGLAYGYRLVPRPNEGLLYLSLYRSTNVLAAYKEVKDIVEAHLQSAALDPVLLDSAKSSMAFEVIERESTIANAVEQSVLAYFKGVNLTYNRALVQKIVSVEPEDLFRVGRKYVSQLFDPLQARMSVVCHPSKVEEVAAGFAKMGFDVAISKSLNDAFLRGC